MQNIDMQKSEISESESSINSRTCLGHLVLFYFLPTIRLYIFPMGWLNVREGKLTVVVIWWWESCKFSNIRCSIYLWIDCLELQKQKIQETRSSWLNCALRDDEAVYWVSIGHYRAVAVGNWWYWVSSVHSCLYILQKVEIWTGVTDAWLTDNFER